MGKIMKKKTLLNLLGAAFLAAATGSATAAVPYAVDKFLFSENLTNSGDENETNVLNDWLDSSAGIAAGYAGFNATFESKTNNASVLAVSNGTLGQWYLDVEPNQPGFFLLKFGNGGTGGADDTYYFENIAELTKLVWSNEQVNFLTGGDCGAKNQAACNIGRLSHYTLFADPPDIILLNSVPEPGSLLLLGLGLVGLAAARLRQA